jgi:hypothetical protein
MSDKQLLNGTDFNIFIIGNTKSGKSSFINSIAGGFVAYSSKLSATYNSSVYGFSRDGNDIEIKKISDHLNKIFEDDQKLKESKKSINFEIRTEVNLKSKYDLEKFKIIDFKGFDGDDNKEVFYAIKKNINNVNLIIYVTDANKPFVQQQEINNFNEIKLMIESHIKTTGHYIDLIVVVNKNDELNDERNDIKKLIGFDKIFRCSSHKLLINNIISNKLNLYVPNFLRTEIKTILNNANVHVTKKIKDNITESGTIKHDDITFLDDDVSSGDWDGLIGYIEKNFREYNEKSISILNDHIELWMKTSFTKVSDIKIIDMITLFNIFREKILRNTNISAITRLNLVIKTINYLFENNSVYLNFFLKTIYQYCCNEKINDIANNVYDKIIQNKHSVSLETKLLVLYHSVEEDIKVSNMFMLYKDIFSSQLLYDEKNNFVIDFYCLKNNKMIRHELIQDEKYGNFKQCMYIHNLLNHKNTPKDLRTLLHLSLLAIPFLQIHRAKKKITDDILNLIDEDTPIKFDLALCYYNDKNFNSNSLHNLLFNLEFIIQKQLEIYKNTDSMHF